MPHVLGASNARITHARELRVRKGRLEHRQFLFEGPTLLQEARNSGAPVDAVYATQAAYDRFPVVREAEADGTDVFLVDERTAKRLSDVQTPSGIVAIATARLWDLAELLAKSGTILALADVSDPGNAGTLIRSADAFGVQSVILGRHGVEPFNPKVVRSAMGSLFRVRLAVASPHELQEAGERAGWSIVGLEASGDPIASAGFPARLILVVGQEHHGLGAWGTVCERTLRIEMPGSAESINAAVAGSIALYAATRGSA